MLQVASFLLSANGRSEQMGEIRALKVFCQCQSGAG